MSEMEATADHVIVIGKGKLVADTTTKEFIQRSSGASVRVVSPRASELTPLLEERGATVAIAEDGAFSATGIEAAQVGDLAAENGIPLHELTPLRVSLEAAFMEMTRDSVEYRSSADGAEKNA